MRLHYLLLIVSFLAGCDQDNSQQSNETKDQTTELEPVSAKNFGEYWYGSGAEITSYALEQARYGEIHRGQAVAVFVTEPFSKSKQVKLDDYKNAGEDKVTVLKLNMTKKFLTGIYPYSMMRSTFVPIDGSAMIKCTTTSQEWCGHTFLQLNKLDSGYRWHSFSYFESEGDKTDTLNHLLTEDELWATIRLNPDQLPTGDIELLPGTFYIRLKHRPIAAQPAEASLSTLESSDYHDKEHSLYQLKYDNRTLKIFFEKELPHRILGWEEAYSSGFGNSRQLTTRAKRKATIRSKYWTKNSNADRGIRKQLQLDTE